MKKNKKTQKSAKSGKSAKKTKKTVKKSAKEKLIGKIDHIFEKIQVVTTTLKAPLKVGDIIHIKGHTTDFIQAVVSMQIEHESVQKAKKGDGVGIKIKDYARDNDIIYMADKKTAAAFRQNISPAAAQVRQPVAVPKDITMQTARNFAAPAQKPILPMVPPANSPTLRPGRSAENIRQNPPKFLNF